MNKTREPILIWSSTLVVLQVITAGAVLSDVVGANVAALFALVVAALQAGTSFYVRGQVTPSSTVVAQTMPDGTLIAGAASDVLDGHAVTVDVQPVDTALPLVAPPYDRDERGRSSLETVLVVLVVIALVLVVAVIVR